MYLLVQTIIFQIYGVIKRKRAMTLKCDMKSLECNLVLMSGIKIIYNIYSMYHLKH